MEHKPVISEKPSAAISIAKAIGANKKGQVLPWKWLQSIMVYWTPDSNGKS